MAESSAPRSGRGLRTVGRLLSNVCFGIAIGLLGHYAITDGVTAAGQKTLRAEVPARVYEDHGDQPGPKFDFSGWRSQDLAYWKSLREGHAFGRLVAPAMGLDVVVVKGVARADLRRGPGWIPYTDPPGPTGNCGISGHRTTYGAPFRHLDRLKPGDIIRFYSPYRVYTYHVRRVFAVRPDSVEVVARTKSPVLTLTACHPPYSARYRLIVQSDLIEVKRIAK